MKSTKQNKDNTGVYKSILLTLLVLNLLFTAFLTYRFYNFVRTTELGGTLTIRRLYKLEQATGTPSPTVDEINSLNKCKRTNSFFELQPIYTCSD